MKDPENEIKVLSSIASVYLNLGEPDLASEALVQAETLAKALNDPSVEAGLLEQEARIAFDRDHLTEARDALERALDLRGQSPRRSTTLNNLGRVLLQLGNREEAEARLFEALRVAQASDRRTQEATVHLNLAKVRLVDRPERALEHCQAALDLFHGEADDLSGEAAAQYCSALALVDLGRPQQARKRIERSIEIVEHLRRRTLHPNQRASYFADRRKYLDLFVALQADLADDEADQEAALVAFLGAERGRARTLAESVSRGLAREPRGRWKDLRREIKETATRFEQTVDPAERRELSQALESLLERYRVMASELAQPGEDIFEPLTREGLATFRDMLDDGTQVLAYHVGAERGFVWLFDRERVVMEELEVDASRLDQQARWVHEQVQSGAAPLQTQLELALETLSGWLLGPVQEHLRGERLVLILDGALHYVPFAALPHDDGTHLIDRFELTRLPSVATFLGLVVRQRERAPPDRSLAVFADPVFQSDDLRLATSPDLDTEGVPEPFLDLTTSAVRSVMGVEVGLKRLPATRHEAMVLADLVPRSERSLFLDFEASRDNLFSEDTEAARIVHLATHALAHPQQPELSGVVLSMFDQQGASLDGFVRAFELADLRLRADLVVLSACRTAIGREVRGEGLLGLTRSFLGNGVPRVVVTLWAVDDKATGDLMATFYQAHLDRGLAPSAALAAAQRSLSRHPRWSAPYYWAGFTLQGDWR